MTIPISKIITVGAVEFSVTKHKRWGFGLGFFFFAYHDLFEDVKRQ